MLLHHAEGMPAGDATAILQCHELEEVLHDGFVHNLLLNMWDTDSHEPRKEKPVEKVDRRTKNRLSARESRAADKEFVKLIVRELEALTETFEMYAAYITQLKVHASNAVDDIASLEKKHAQNKVHIAMLQESYLPDAPTLMGMSTKERNRIHARKSRERKQQFVHNLIQQRDDSWSTIQDVVQYTTALEGRCSVLHDFDDTGYVLLKLTETRQMLLMRRAAHKQKREEMQSLSSYRKMRREKF